MENVVEFIGLTDPRWSDRIHDLGHSVWIDGAVWVSTRRRTYSKRVRPWRRGEAARLVWAKAILPGQRHRKAPTQRGCSTQAGCRHAECNVARDGIRADRHRT